MTVMDWAARVHACEQAMAEADVQLRAGWVQETVSSYSLQWARMRRDAQGFHLVDVMDHTGTLRTAGETIIGEMAGFAWMRNTEPKLHEIAFSDFEDYLQRPCEELYAVLGCDRILVQDADLISPYDARDIAAGAARDLFVARCAALLHSTPDLQHFRYTWQREFDDVGCWDLRDLQVAAINGADPDGDPALPAVQALLDDADDWFSAAFDGREEDVVHTIDVSYDGVEILLDR